MTVDRAGARVERLARAVVAVATVWLVLAVSWGLFARVAGGHEAQIATRAIVAENMREWGTLAVIKDYTFNAPGYELYYAHHPWGTFWTISAFAELLGRGTWVPKLVGVLLSAPIPALLYGIGRDLWGPVPGAVSAVAYVVLPITLAFGNLAGFELPIIFSCLLATWGYLRFARRWERKWMWVSVAGMVAAIHSDWQGAVFIGAVLALLAARALAFPSWFGGVRLRPFAQWWVLTALLTAVSLLGYVAYFQHIGAIEELAHSESWRARGATTPLGDLLRARSYWIDVTFTPLVVTLGKIALPIFVARVVFWRKFHEIFPLALLLMATLQYVKFTNGANVHIYWPLPFAPYWALSLGMFCATGIETTKEIAARSGRHAERVATVALATFGLVALLVLPDGIRGLRFARATAGRFEDKGRRIIEDVDLSEAAEWIKGSMEGKTVVGLASDIYSRENREIEWALHRPIRGIDVSRYVAGVHEERYLIGDLRTISGPDQRRAAATLRLVTLGPYVFVDAQAPYAPLDAFRFDEREPNLFEWYFLSPTEPMRTVRPDPWSTWELREHFNQTPNPVPTGEPDTLEEIRIAHNVAVAEGNTEAQEKWQKRLLSSIDSTVATSYTEGIRLLGKRFVRGVDPQLELYFSASGPMSGDLAYEVISRVVAPPRLSLVPADDKVKKYGTPFVVSPRLWRTGFIYLDRIDVRKRPGKEDFIGFFESKDAPNVKVPRRADAADEALPLLSLE